MKSVVIYYTLLDGFHKSGGRNKSGEGGAWEIFQKLVSWKRLFGILGYSKLLQSSRSVSMETQRLCSIAWKDFKALNNLDPNLMTKIFYRFSNQTHRKGNLYVHTRNTIKFRSKILGQFRPPCGTPCLKIISKH